MLIKKWIPSRKFGIEGADWCARQYIRNFNCSIHIVINLSPNINLFFRIVDYYIYRISKFIRFAGNFHFIIAKRTLEISTSYIDISTCSLEILTL